jgi:hypothetical protein
MVVSIGGLPEQAGGKTSENDSDEILTLDRPSIIVCDHAKGAHAVFRGYLIRLLWSF